MFRFLIILVFTSLLFSCESFRPVYVNNTFQGKQIKLSRYSDGCCGCQANIIDIKTSDTSEVRYWLHCNCSFNESMVSKNVIVLKSNKVQTIKKYEALYSEPHQGSEFLLDHLDSLVLLTLPKSMNLDYSRNCDSTTHHLKLITGFKKVSESTNPRNVKPYFRKKVKL